MYVRNVLFVYSISRLITFDKYNFTSLSVVEKLKEIMEDIENSIMNFKREQREK